MPIERHKILQMAQDDLGEASRLRRHPKVAARIMGWRRKRLGGACRRSLEIEFSKN